MTPMVREDGLGHRLSRTKCGFDIRAQAPVAAGPDRQFVVEQAWRPQRSRHPGVAPAMRGHEDGSRPLNASDLGKGPPQRLADGTPVVFQMVARPIRRRVDNPGFIPGAAGFRCVTAHPGEWPAVDEGAVERDRQRRRVAEHQRPARLKDRLGGTIGEPRRGLATAPPPAAPAPR